MRWVPNIHVPKMEENTWLHQYANEKKNNCEGKHVSNSPLEFEIYKMFKLRHIHVICQFLVVWKRKSGVLFNKGMALLMVQITTLPMVRIQALCSWSFIDWTKLAKVTVRGLPFYHCTLLLFPIKSFPFPKYCMRLYSRGLRPKWP